MTFRRLDRSGVSIVELLIGVVLLTIVVISLAAAGMYASRITNRSQIQLDAADYMQSELERLLAVPYSELQNGSRTTAKGTSIWTVQDQGTYRELVLVTNYAPIEGISMSDTVIAYRLRR